MANNEGNIIWLVLVLKDKFATDSDREQLRNGIVSNFNLKPGDVCYVRKEDGEALSNFLFVREYHHDTDLKDILEFRRDMFESYPAHMRITGDELDTMIGGIESAKRSVTVKHGDIVVVKNGVYSKLYGIVLRENRSGKVEVGLKFCFGTVTEQYSPKDLTVIGNIFKNLKVLR